MKAQIFDNFLDINIQALSTMSNIALVDFREGRISKERHIGIQETLAIQREKYNYGKLLLRKHKYVR